MASPFQGDYVARSYGGTLTALFAVKRRLDLEKMGTAMRYVEQYAVECIESKAVDETQR